MSIQKGGFNMLAKVHKWGNSLGVRIPNAFAKEAQINDGSSISIHMKNNKLILIPVKKEYSLKEMLSEINSNNIHKEVSTGHRTGKEIW